jgi:hypothetical protein
MHVADMRAANDDASWVKIWNDPVQASRYLTEWRELAEAGCTAVRRRLARSFVLTALPGVIAVVAALALGAIGTALPWSLPKILLLTGTFLMAWATVLALGTSPMYWDGPPLHERVIPPAFLAIFLPGVALALLGGLL